MKNTSIEVADNTFNPWKLRNGELKRTSAATWRQPLRWNKEAGERTRYWEQRLLDAAPLGPEAIGIIKHYRNQEHRPRVFCASMADWLDDEAPIEWLADLLDLIRQTPNLDWLLLTKRPETFFDRIWKASNWCDLNGKQEVASWTNWWTDVTTGGPPPNVWIGTSVENQEAADTRIPYLLRIPAEVRFLSAEPLLGPVNLRRWTEGRRGCSAASCYCGAAHALLGQIHWVIAGGESGRNVRPLHPDWARSLRDQCAVAGVPFFFKQWGEWIPGGQQPFPAIELPDDKCQILDRNGCQFVEESTLANGEEFVFKVGKKRAGRLLDGVEHNGFPEVLR